MPRRRAPSLLGPPPSSPQRPCLSQPTLRLALQAARSANATFTFLRNLPNKAVAIYLNELDLSVARVKPSETVELSRVAAVGVMPEVCRRTRHHRCASSARPNACARAEPPSLRLRQAAVGMTAGLKMSTPLFQQTAAKNGSAAAF